MKPVTRHSLQFLLLLAVAAGAGVAWWWFSRPVLRLYIWNDYLFSDVIHDFELRERVRVKVTNYTSNAEMMSRVKVSWNEFDVIMPSSYMVGTMRHQGLLVKLTDRDVPNRRDIDPKYLAEYQCPEARPAEAMVTLPGAARAAAPKVEPTPAVTEAPPASGRDSDYALPYLWNCAGIGYSKVDYPGGGDADREPPGTWQEFFSAKTAAKHGQRLLMLDEPRELIGLVLIAQGKCPNTRNPDEIKAAGRLLRELQEAGRPRLVLGEGRDLLESGQAALLQTWAPEITMAMKRVARERPLDQRVRDERARFVTWVTDLFTSAEKVPVRHPEIGYRLPDDGSIITIDTLAIPRSSKQQELAKKFINYLLQPKVAARVTRRSFYANTVTGGGVPELAGTASLAEPKRDDRRFYLTGVGDAQHFYDAVWADFARANKGD